MNHTTLTQFKRYQGLADSNTADDTLIAMLANQADQWLDNVRDSKPLRETRKFDYPGSEPLFFGDDLLEVITLTNGDASVVAAADFVMRPTRSYPKWAISLRPNVSWTFTDDQLEAIGVLGVWGYHDDYSNAWVTSRDAVADALGINASVTTITVSDADGISGDYETPRFQAGNLIKIESEYLDVISVNATLNTLTVVRGVRGTTAAAHVITTPITLWRSARSVQEATMQYMKWRYNLKDMRGANGYTIGEIPADITALLPPALEAYP